MKRHHFLAFGPKKWPLSTRRKRTALCGLLGLLLISFPLHAAGQVNPEQLPPPAPLTLAVERYKLPNGLRVVLNPDRSAPTAAVCVTYDVGSRNEVQGRSGFAHLFEHVMFQGSRNVPKGGHFTLVSDRGGSLNGTTSSDRTNYHQVVPSNALQTMLWLEADRMKSLAVTQENFENQRRVVQEEYRMRVSNAAYAQGLMTLGNLAYGNYWPYAHDTIGSMADLDAAKIEWLREFHKAYYAPNNAVLSIAGDFDRDQVLTWVNEYFGSAKPTQAPPYTPPPFEEQTAERQKTVTDTNAKTVGVLYGWVIPPFRTKEHYALEVATLILGFGDSSVLHQQLVQEDGVARHVATWTYDRRGPDLLVIRTLLTERARVEQVQAAIDQQIQRLATKGPTLEELNRAKQQVRSHFLFNLEGNLERSEQLGSYELFWGDANELNNEVVHYGNVTRAEVQQAVAKYLTEQRRSTVLVLPPTPDGAPGNVNPAPSSAPSP